MWRRATDDRWFRGPVQLHRGEEPDGSIGLLAILAGDPKQYVEFASDYHERRIAVADVAAVYRHESLTEELVGRLHPVVDLESLAGDVDEIGYPEAG